jgi:glycosyltransferase involved in cell wall biosynthesis
MRIYYKNETKLTNYLESKYEVTLFKQGGFLTKIGFKQVEYPDLYFHSGSLNSFSKTLIENSKLILVNSIIAKKEILKKCLVKPNKIEVILPAIETKKFKKKEIKIPFYEKYNINEEKKIIYFSAKNMKQAGFEQFCKICQNLEMANYQVVVSCFEDKEEAYAKDVLKHYDLDDAILLFNEEVYDVADIFILPTSFSNFSRAVLKAMAAKCAVFVNNENHAIDILDVFAMMDGKNDPNISYKTDMLLRVTDELKKIQKENYKKAKELTYEKQQEELELILEKHTII